MSLARRIATQPSVALTKKGMEHYQSQPSYYDSLLSMERQLISSSVHLRVDNVAQFYFEHSRDVWDSKEDIPNWAPPWPTVFVEWSEPDQMRLHGQLIKNSGRCQAGVLSIAADVDDHTRPQRDCWRRLMGDVPDGTQCDKMLSSLADAKWFIIQSQWVTSFDRPLCGRPMWMGRKYFFTIRNDGRLLENCMVGMDETADGSVWSPAHIVGLSFSFCHCKNVIRKEMIEEAEKTKRGQPLRPAVKYYVLDIDPMRNVLRTEGRSGEVGMAKALHTCRGHFATYTSESPLFGKYTGMFYRPLHVRGRIEAGVTLKDYSVDKPTDES